MDNEQRIQSILSDTVDKLAEIGCNASQQAALITITMKSSIKVGHLPDLSRVITKFAQDQIELLKKERDN